MTDTAGSKPTPDEPPEDAPNVVLVHCHDLGRHLGCYGRDVATPNVDALAGEGMRFESYFAAAPTCSPSRASAATGRYPHQHGLLGLVHRGWELDPGETTLAEYLGRAGYDTHLFGLQHVSRTPDGLGYDHVHTETERAGEVAAAFRGRIDEVAAGGPFFGAVGFHEPHRPFRREDAPGAADRYDPAEIDLPGSLPDDPDVRADLASFQGLVTSVVDPAVGVVREAIDDAGITDETLLIFTTDHGVSLPRAKATCLDAGLECALVVRPPGGADGGTCGELLSNVDLVPTVLDCTGVDIPDSIAGQSFAPLLSGDRAAYEPRDRIFAEQNWHVQPAPCRAVRTREAKYIFNLCTQIRHPGKVVDSAGRITPEEELYDLRTDPNETENLASDRTFYDGPPHQTRAEWDSGASEPDPDYRDLLDRLRGELHAWMAATDDPLLSGCLPLSSRERGRLAALDK